MADATATTTASRPGPIPGTIAAGKPAEAKHTAAEGKEVTAPFILQSGKHTILNADGTKTVFRAGDTVELNERQAKLFKNRFRRPAHEFDVAQED